MHSMRHSVLHRKSNRKGNFLDVHYIVKHILVSFCKDVNISISTLYIIFKISSWPHSMSLFLVSFIRVNVMNRRT